MFIWTASLSARSNLRAETLAVRKTMNAPLQAPVGYRAAPFADDAGMLNRAFCSSLSVA